MPSFFELDRNDINSLLAELSVPKAHTKAIMANGYKKHAIMPWASSYLPKKIAYLNDTYPAKSLPPVKILQSGYDASLKFLFELGDQEKIETVLMPETSRLTLCVSSQVGCRQACSFCHTGRMGLKRNLSAGEIVAQVVSANRWLTQNPHWLTQARLAATQKISNIVFMGMGEPLDNVNEVIKSIKIMLDHYSLSLSAKKITVSTAGHLEGLKELINAKLGVSIALSLHATNDRDRSRLMPINRRFPIADVLAYLNDYSKLNKEKVLIQYTVIEGVNDSDRHANELSLLLKDSLVKINLIPFNPIGPSRLSPPSPAQLERFAKILYKNGFQTMIRFSKGQDIAAACGQLIV